jgi:hypothetical protein
MTQAEITIIGILTQLVSDPGNASLWSDLVEAWKVRAHNRLAL